MNSAATAMSVLLLFALCLLPAGANSTTPRTPSCPMDFTFTRTLPWNSSCCVANRNQTCCCEDLFRLLGISLSLRLQRTNTFALRDPGDSAACLDSLQSLLATSISLPPATVTSCFPSDVLDVNTKTCAGIHTLQDWDRRLGSTALAASCVSIPPCGACTSAMLTVSLRLTALDRNASNFDLCYYYTVVYTAAVATGRAPTDADDVRCLFRLPLRDQMGSGGGGSGPRSRVIWGCTAAAVAASAALACALICWQRRVQSRREACKLDFGVTWFTVEELRRATGDFSVESLVGCGGFGAVYRGVLPDGSVVAVKRLASSRDDAGGDAEFANEVRVVSNLRHRNLVALRGCCVGADRRRYLVYDYMPNGGLHGRLFGAGEPLTWAQRRGIVLDVARGLAYLHHEAKPPIVHRDVKPGNVVLDGEMRAAVADFGMARRREEGSEDGETTSVAGTHGYLAPEYALYGHLSAKVDVYSFGVMVLEVLSGRRALDLSAPAGEEAAVLAEWAREMAAAGRTAEVVEEAMASAENERAAAEMDRFVRVGCLCSHLRVGARPTMAEALKMLEGDLDVPAEGSWEMGIGEYLETMM